MRRKPLLLIVESSTTTNEWWIPCNSLEFDEGLNTKHYRNTTETVEGWKGKVCGIERERETKEKKYMGGEKKEKGKRKQINFICLCEDKNYWWLINIISQK